MAKAKRAFDIPSDVTVDEACTRLACSRPTVYSLMKTGALAFYKLGRATRITVESLEDLRSSGSADDLKKQA